MNTQVVRLSQLVINEHNPRTQTKEKHEQTITSLLTFPKMLNYRPIVVREDMTVLGGNMRTVALRAIEKMEMKDIRQRVEQTQRYKHLKDRERNKLSAFWNNWLKNPTVQIVIADDFSEEDENEFIIKDNLSYGKWNTEMLANEFDEEMLKEFGMDDWVFGSDVNIDDLFEGFDGEQKEKDFKFSVVVDHDKESIMDEVKQAVKDAIAKFDGVKLG